jgi:hypothetical protein
VRNWISQCMLSPARLGPQRQRSRLRLRDHEYELQILLKRSLLILGSLKNGTCFGIGV